MIYSNRVSEFEADLCGVLAQVAHFVHPKIVERVQSRNVKEYDYFCELFEGRIEIKDYLTEGSACIFPGVRRYVSGEGQRSKYNEPYRAIIDDNKFPLHLWCHLTIGRVASSDSRKKSGLSEFELAHVFAHKVSEIGFENRYFQFMPVDSDPHGDFTCACNTVLLPKGTARPTDHSESTKASFFKRYIDLYGEAPLRGRVGFKEELIPSWYPDLIWNEPVLPEDWEIKVEKLLVYRKKRITDLLNKID